MHVNGHTSRRIQFRYPCDNPFWRSKSNKHLKWVLATWWIGELLTPLNYSWKQDLNLSSDHHQHLNWLCFDDNFSLFFIRETKDSGLGKRLLTEENLSCRGHPSVTSRRWFYFSSLGVQPEEWRWRWYWWYRGKAMLIFSCLMHPCSLFQFKYVLQVEGWIYFRIC